MNVLITGANGFVGRALCRRLQTAPPFPMGTLYGTMRSPDHPVLPKVSPIYADLETLAASPDRFPSVDCVVHLAARVHQMQDRVTDPLAAFRQVNTISTRQLAIAAAQAGVQRFVYLSTVKVLGEGTGHPLTATNPLAPADPYGISKAEAEVALRQISQATGMEVVILRPPLVYGAGVKANFLQLLRWVYRGVPLPLGAVQNARSLVYVGNLVDAIAVCMHHPGAAGETFLVADGVPVSTPALIRAIAHALHCPARLIPVPPMLLRWGGTLTGKSAALDRLLGSLVVDSTPLRQNLTWQPPYSLTTGLADTADWFHRICQKSG